MKRIGIIIAQKAPGLDEWGIIGGPTTEVGLLVDQVRLLPPGDQIVQVIATNTTNGLLKRVKCRVDFGDKPKAQNQKVK